MGKEKYYLVRECALPEVLLKVVEAKRLLDSERVMTIQEATDAVDISRSSFYKYKDDVLPFHENVRGKTINLMLQVDDTPGLLSKLLGQVAKIHANILTIHQSIPINGVAALSISAQVLSTTGDISGMVEAMEKQQGVHHIKIAAKE